jgi:hypothetical protein
MFGGTGGGGARSLYPGCRAEAEPSIAYVKVPGGLHLDDSSDVVTCTTVFLQASLLHFALLTSIASGVLDSCVVRSLD